MRRHRRAKIVFMGDFDAQAAARDHDGIRQLDDVKSSYQLI